MEKIPNNNNHSEISNINTPRIPEATKSQNPVFREVHALTDKKYPHRNEETITTTRKSILNRYNITQEHVVDFDQDGNRHIRAFTILQHQTDLTKIFYCEGHAPHALLLNTILKKFESKIGVSENLDLDLDIWFIKKGFLDPNQNGFKSFPETRKHLTKTYNQNKKINGNDSDIDENHIPNWFLSGDSSS